MGRVGNVGRPDADSSVGRRFTHLFGVIYAIVVTITDVLIAMIGTGGSWLWSGIYSIVSLGGLALALFIFPQAVIAAMRWVVERNAVTR